MREIEINFAQDYRLGKSNKNAIVNESGEHIATVHDPVYSDFIIKQLNETGDSSFKFGYLLGMGTAVIGFVISHLIKLI